MAALRVPPSKAGMQAAIQACWLARGRERPRGRRACRSVRRIRPKRRLQTDAGSDGDSIGGSCGSRGSNRGTRAALWGARRLQPRSRMAFNERKGLGLSLWSVSAVRTRPFHGIRGSTRGLFLPLRPSELDAKGPGPVGSTWWRACPPPFLTSAPLGGADWLPAILLTCGMIFADYAADCTQGRDGGSVESGKVVHLFQLFGLARCCKHGLWGYIGWVETDLGD